VEYLWIISHSDIVGLTFGKDAGGSGLIVGQGANHKLAGEQRAAEGLLAGQRAIGLEVIDPATNKLVTVIASGGGDAAKLRRGGIFQQGPEGRLDGLYVVLGQTAVIGGARKTLPRIRCGAAQKPGGETDA
jgi:hypothetical protein